MPASDDRGEEAAEHVDRLLTPPFAFLLATMFLVYAHQGLFTPAIPLYVDEEGGSPLFAGLALLAFSVPSFAVRPHLGRLCDSWSTAGVLALGLVLLVTGGLLLLDPFLAMVFPASIVRGLGWAGVNTGGYTTLAQTAPLQRRGEASGYFSSVTSAALALFPAVALWIIEGPGYPPLFALAAALALFGLPLVAVTASAGSGRQDTTDVVVAAAPGTSADRAPLVDRGVLLATVLNLCAMLVLPAVIAFLPVYALSLDAGSVAPFYVIAGVVSVTIRPILGKRSDSMGRGPLIAVGLGAQLVGLLVIAAADGRTGLMAGGVVAVVGISFISSTTMALAIDMAHPRSTGRSMATYSISFQLGNGLGAVFAGALAGLGGFRGMYVGAAAITLVAVGVLVAAWRRLPGAVSPT